LIPATAVAVILRGFSQKREPALFMGQAGGRETAASFFTIK
jgi:hypothetical protein